MNIKSAIILMTAVLIVSIAQVLLKLSAEEQHSSYIREFFNYKVIIAYSLIFSSSIVTILAYKTLPLKYGAVIETTGYVYILILSKIFFGNKITKNRLAGITLIIFGVIIFVL